ncbi:uncharacterized protein LOC119983416 [Tripterygium wilfordii]|uniref:uncharacterized protein LOC119983416 n=1 Tax=Tripterygium wilfordii TaxID=458696 RepID=UPI0018F849E1|nr:uncharacterized protein LOC119983416 [Tripterygium wilfordii]
MFNGKDAMIKWAREVARRNGFVLVIKRSTMTEKRRKLRLTLACERSGKYRKFVKADHDIPENKRRKGIGTKKCNCPFILKGNKVSDKDEWMLHVVCGVHNHLAVVNMEEHSFIGRLSLQESNLIADMSNSMERAGRSQMQKMLGKLKERKYLEWHRWNDDTQTMRDLFFAHPTSVDLLRTFPEILIMDCTYKTNRYRLSLLEIVGITSTNLTFSVAFVYLEAERKDNYI